MVWIKDFSKCSSVVSKTGHFANDLLITYIYGKIIMGDRILQMTFKKIMLLKMHNLKTYKFSFQYGWNLIISYHMSMSYNL